MLHIENLHAGMHSENEIFLCLKNFANPLHK